MCMLQAVQGWGYHAKKYRVAMNKTEQCKVDLLPMWGETPGYDLTKYNMSDLTKEYHEYCPKSKSDNIIFCPQEIINRKKGNKVFSEKAGDDYTAQAYKEQHNS